MRFILFVIIQLTFICSPALGEGFRLEPSHAERYRLLLKAGSASETLEALINERPVDPALFAIKDKLSLQRDILKALDDNEEIDINQLQRLVALNAWVLTYQKINIILLEAKEAGFNGETSASLTESAYQGVSADELVQLERIHTQDMFSAANNLLADALPLQDPLITVLCGLVTGHHSCDMRQDEPLNFADRILAMNDVFGLRVGPRLSQNITERLNIRNESLDKTFCFFTNIWPKIFDCLGSLPQKQCLAKSMLPIGFTCPQSAADFVRAVQRVSCSCAADYELFSKAVQNAERSKIFWRLIETTDSLEGVVNKTAPRPDIDIERYTPSIINPRAGQVVEEVRLLRVYGTYDIKEVPDVKKFPGASQISGFWTGQLYKSEEAFRQGAVVFREWNAARHIVQIKVKPGVVLIFGQGRSQHLQADQTLDGMEKVLKDSGDGQFSFFVDSDWLAKGNRARDWTKHLLETGMIEIIEDIPTGW